MPKEKDLLFIAAINYRDDRDCDDRDCDDRDCDDRDGGAFS